MDPTRLLHAWDFPGKNTGVGYHFLLQGTFLTQGSHPGLLHYRQRLYHWSHQGRQDTWSNRQIWLWRTKQSRSKANRVLPREYTGHRKHPLSTTQEKILHMDITRWSILTSDWLYSLQPKMEKLYAVSKNKTGSRLWLRSWAPYCQIQT